MPCRAGVIFCSPCLSERHLNFLDSRFRGNDKEVIRPVPRYCRNAPQTPSDLHRITKNKNCRFYVWQFLFKDWEIKIYFVLAIVLMHLVHILSFLPLIFLDCRFMCCRLIVLILECERLASLVEPRPHKSHFLAIVFKKNRRNSNEALTLCWITLLDKNNINMLC